MIRGVEHTKLVVHVVGAVVQQHGDAGGAQALDVAALALGLVVVGDDADGDAAVVPLQQRLGNLVAGDVEHADLNRLPRRLDVPQESRQRRFLQVFGRRVVGGGGVVVRGGGGGRGVQVESDASSSKGAPAGIRTVWA